MPLNGFWQKLSRWRTGYPIVVFHEFKKPPYGGGNQFLLALRSEWEKMGVTAGTNRVGTATSSVLFNSYNFDFDSLYRLRQSKIRMVHRVDGPIGVYRGNDDGTDQRIWQVNHDLADVTVFQSEYSLAKHRELGLEFKSPVVITNAVNPDIFHPDPAASKKPHERIRLVASAWSDNPRKGGPIYQWLDDHLDHDRFEFTFVGRIKTTLKRARVIDAVPSATLAGILREQDIYITASEHDPCSNALLEALSCGLPAVYLHSGGHPELVKNGGCAFRTKEELIPAIEKVAGDYDAFRARIEVPRIDAVARRYLELLR